VINSYNKIRCTNFSNLFLEYNSTSFGQFLCPPSGVFHCKHSNGMCHRGLLTACELSANLYDIYYCCVYSENSWWWTEELTETCRVLFQKQIWEISVSSWFSYKNSISCITNLIMLFEKCFHYMDWESVCLFVCLFLAAWSTVRENMTNGYLYFQTLIFSVSYIWENIQV